MQILGIESTCDETGVAVVENGVNVLSDLLGTSIALQKEFGGVVPEIAAREQVKLITPLLSKIKTELGGFNVDAISVAYGPGLVGSLVVGVETAKILSYVLQKPLIPVNHLVGHFFSCWLEKNSLPKLPAIGLIVSGGHTDIVFVTVDGKIEHLGGTIDDAAGEAFDKIAKQLGLPYPGGPEIQKSSNVYFPSSDAIEFPRPMINKNNFDFSFSGLKTSVINYLSKTDTLSSTDVSRVSYYFQKAVVEVLVTKTIKAALEKNVTTIVVGGGVAANTSLRKVMIEECKNQSISVYFPEKNYSVDNGAMIAAAAFFVNKTMNPLKLIPNSTLHFD